MIIKILIIFIYPYLHMFQMKSEEVFPHWLTYCMKIGISGIIKAYFFALAAQVTLTDNRYLVR